MKSEADYVRKSTYRTRVMKSLKGEIYYNYDNLFLDESFLKLVKDTENRTGFKFIDCNGGYGSQLDDNRFDFIFNDEIYIVASFDMGDGRIAAYEIDFDNMRFVGDYSVY